MNKKSNIIDSKDLLMLSLVKFYSNKDAISKIIPIINGKSPISLRLIDWFITNYAKKNGTIITKSIDKNIVHFNVYLSYRSQLKAYSKQLFDPFRRRDRITFFYDKSKSIETTIGQLNLFRFLVQHGLLEYIEENIDAIEADMIASQKHLNATVKRVISDGSSIGKTTQDVGATRRKKRIELSQSITKNMSRFEGHRKIQFD
jgi:hypothetical protein